MVVMHARGPAAAPATASSSSAPARPQQQQQSQHQVGQYDSEMIRLQVLGNPQLMENLRQSNLELAEAVNNPERFHVLFRDMERKKQEAERQKQREIVSRRFSPMHPHYSCYGENPPSSVGKTG
jgi:DNA damage-inducible protein 1